MKDLYNDIAPVLLKEPVDAVRTDWTSNLIDLGAEQGLKVGQQLTAFSKPEGERPPRAAANVVVVGLGRATATVKVLSARDALRRGDLVQLK